MNICSVCFCPMDRGRIPLTDKPYLPSRSKGDDSSFVRFGVSVCLRCRLLNGYVIEYREGFAFLGRDGQLYSVELREVRSISTLHDVWIISVVDRDGRKRRVDGDDDVWQTKRVDIHFDRRKEEQL